MKIAFAVRTSLLVGLFFIASFFGDLAFAGCGSSVGWATPKSDMPKITMSKVIAKVKATRRVIVTKSSMQAKCGEDYDYTVTDAKTGQFLGAIPIPHTSEANDDGQYLLVRTQQLLETPKDQLIAINAASDVFCDDVRGLEEELGIGAYIPNAYAIEKRTKNNGESFLIYTYIEEACSEQGSMSPQNLSVAEVKTLEYVPGRKNYDQSTLYQKGDLKKMFFSDQELFGKVKAQVTENAKYCNPYDGKNRWIALADQLNGPIEELSKSTFDHFLDVKKTISGAYMLNEYRIAISYSDETKEFAGTISEILEIQKNLKDRGILIDKTSRLDMSGKIAVDVAKEMNRPLPSTLAN